jgi:hypothetical protein
VDQLAVTLSELGSLALIGWIVLPVIQLRLLQVQRREEIVLRLYEPLLSEPLTRACWRVQTWPWRDFASFHPAGGRDPRQSGSCTVGGMGGPGPSPTLRRWCAPRTCDSRTAGRSACTMPAVPVRRTH